MIMVPQPTPRLRAGQPSLPGAAAPSDEATSAAWEEAFVRVESYLRAHRLEQRSRLARLTAAIVERARTERLAHETPVAAAMRLADGHINAWIERIVSPHDEQPELTRRRARLAIEIAEVPDRWPDAFLADEPAPAALGEAVRAAYVEAGPELRFSNMAPRPIDLGPVANLAGQTWDTVRRRPLLRSVLFWGFTLILAVALWRLFQP